MRQIIKAGQGPSALHRRHARPPSSAEEARQGWQRYKDKSQLSDWLCEEQYGLCAYSEIRPDQFGLGTHIEHIAPKSRHPDRTFDYQNLLLVALSSDDLKQRAADDLFGGHAKGSDYDAQRFLSPLTSGCAEAFLYRSDGQVVPRANQSPEQQHRARYTIDLLNLNCPYLLNQRKRWIDELDDLIDQYLEDRIDLNDLAEVYLLPRLGRLDPFFTASRQRFGLMAEKILRDQAAPLC